MPGGIVACGSDFVITHGSFYICVLWKMVMLLLLPAGNRAPLWLRQILDLGSVTAVVLFS